MNEAEWEYAQYCKEWEWAQYQARWDEQAMLQAQAQYEATNLKIKNKL